MPQQKANRFISILYRYSQRYFTQQLRRIDCPIEVGEMPCFLQACRHPGISQDGIAANLHIDKATVARTLQRLEHSGYIRREPCETDRRMNLIYATDPAEPIFRQVQELIEQYHQMLYSGMTEEEIQVAVQMLIRMKENVSRTLRCRQEEDQEER